MDKYQEESDDQEAEGQFLKDCSQKNEVKKAENVIEHSQMVKGLDEEEDMMRNICLPSIKDSKLWRIKVTPGRERELVFKITNKLIEYLNNGDPLNVLDVFESQIC